MNRAQRKRCFDLFDELAQRSDAEQQRTLDELRPREPEIAEELEALLAADRRPVDDADLVPGRGADVLATGLWRRGNDGLARVGRYRVIGELGRGGMGIVYEAEQEKPRRTVALKVVADVGGIRGIERRFEREAELLGRLHHPGIARIYEAGTARAEDTSGRASDVSFFAMELVRGRRIDVACEERGLGRRARLELVARVCDAVQHAHDMGVVHRDLKPENIFVNDAGDPTVLDFGIARITDSDVQAATVQTEVGQLLGTVAYMSPEQIGGDPAAIDGRVDVYALGVILFRLLAERMPFDIAGKPLAEAARVVQHEEPTSLSTIDRSMRGDIETIVLTALDKDRDRRYPDPAALAADIRRYLQDEPLIARPATTLYQLKKFAVRNRALVGGVAASIALLAAGVIGTSIALAWALRTKDILEEANADLLRVTEFQARTLEDLDATEFGQTILERVRADFRRGHEYAGTPAVEIGRLLADLDESLDDVNGTNIARSVIHDTIGRRAEDRIDAEFVQDPLLEAELRRGVGTMYASIGLTTDAMAQFQTARDLAIQHAGPDAELSVRATFSLGRMHSRAGRWADAERYIREAIDRHDRAFGTASRRRFDWLNMLGHVYRSTSRHDEALACYEEVLTPSGRPRGPRPRAILAAENNTAVILMDQGRLDEALDLLRDVRERRVEIYGAEAHTTLIVGNNLMSVLFRLGRIEEAEPLARELLASTARAEGTTHQSTIRVRNNLGRILLDTGRPEEAVEVLRLVHTHAQSELPPLDEVRLTGAANLIDALIALEQFEEAAIHARALLVSRRAVIPPNDFQTSQTLEQLGICLIELGQHDEAAAALAQCIDVRSGINNDHWLTHWARHVHAVARLGQHPGDPAARRALRAAAVALDARRDDITPTRREWIFDWIARWSLSGGRTRACRSGSRADCVRRVRRANQDRVHRSRCARPSRPRPAGGPRDYGGRSVCYFCPPSEILAGDRTHRDSDSA